MHIVLEKDDSEIELLQTALKRNAGAAPTQIHSSLIRQRKDHKVTSKLQDVVTQQHSALCTNILIILNPKLETG